MTTPTNETHHRDQRRQTVYDRAITVARRQYANLTPGQHVALAVAIRDHAAFGTYIADGSFDPGDDWIASEYKNAMEYLQPEMFRPVPDAQTLTLALVAKLPADALPQERVNIARRVQRMNDDERLAASEGLDLKPAPKSEPAPDTRTPEQIARNYTPEDIELERRGFDVDALLPSKRKELRQKIADERAPKPTPALDKVRLDHAAGKKSAPEAMMSADREARALGKRLADFLR